jgi:hypothetical protein
MKRTFCPAALALGLFAVTATAQDMMRHVDLSSPDMVSAEMTRAEVEAAFSHACRFHRQESIQPRPVRARSVRRDLSRGAD